MKVKVSLWALITWVSFPNPIKYPLTSTSAPGQEYRYTCITHVHTYTQTKNGEKDRLIILIKLCSKQLLARLSRSIISVKWSFFVITYICLSANHVNLPRIYSSYFSCCCYKILNKINVSKETFWFPFSHSLKGLAGVWGSWSHFI